MRNVQTKKTKEVSHVKAAASRAEQRKGSRAKEAAQRKPRAAKKEHTVSSGAKRGGKSTLGKGARGTRSAWGWGVNGGTCLSAAARREKGRPVTRTRFAVGVLSAVLAACVPVPCSPAPKAVGARIGPPRARSGATTPTTCGGQTLSAPWPTVAARPRCQRLRAQSCKRNPMAMQTEKRAREGREAWGPVHRADAII